MKLNDLLKKGWKETDINKDEFKVLRKKDYSMIYSIKTNKIIIKYYSGKNK